MEELAIKNIPIQKWIFITISVNNRIVDVYINGILAKRHRLKNIITSPGVNHEIAGNQFDGFISNLIYYPKPLTSQEIEAIIINGPSLN